MAFLSGWQRRLALLPLCLFLLGWFAYSVGFVWKLIRWDQTSLNSTTFIPVPISRNDPLTFPYYVILVGGPLVFILALLHAVLPSVASSIVGLVSAFVSSIFFVSVGWAIYSGGLYFQLVINLNLSVDMKSVLIFGGALFALLCWCFVMMLSVSYDYRSTPNTYGLENYNEIFNVDRRQETSRIRNIPFTPGLARIFSLPFVIVSAIGWCVFVVGVDRMPNLVALNSRYHLTHQSSFYFSFYGSIVVGPLLYLSALLHAGCLRGASTVMGVFTSILHAVYVVLMGYCVTELGRFIYFSCQDSSLPQINCSVLPSAIDVNVIYVFVGGAGSLLFWTFVLALWPFYRKHPSLVRGSDTDGRDTDTINATNPVTYGTMQMRDSLSYSSYMAQHPRQSIVIAESGEHK